MPGTRAAKSAAEERHSRVGMVPKGVAEGLELAAVVPYRETGDEGVGSPQRDIGVHLGELAIAMETRVHRRVSMDVATGVNNRSPLDRSLWERLATVSPADGTLPIDANADAELLHVTANNGLCRPAPHSQIPHEMEEELQSQLGEALDHGSLIRLSHGVPGPVTGRDAWTWTAVEASGGLFAVVYRQAGERRGPKTVCTPQNGWRRRRSAGSRR